MITPINASGRTKATKDKVYLADWRYGADYAFSNSTDSIRSGTDTIAELALYKHNLRGGVFIDRYSGSQYNAPPNMRYDLYFQSDRWNIGAGNVVIPDYYATTWTSAGASAFSGAVEGDAKDDRYPNHGQQIYDISGGVYGYDFTTGTIGSNNLAELNNMVEAENTWFFNQYGRYPSTISWRNGQDWAYKLLEQYYVGGRNSYSNQSGDSYSNGHVNYGTFLGKPTGFFTPKNYVNVREGDNPDLLGRQDIVSTPCSVRYRSMGIQQSYPLSITYLKSQIASIASNRGRYHNFFHWHDLSGTPTLIGDCFQAESQQIVANTEFCWKATFGEIYEYIAARKCVSSLWWEPNGSDVDIKIRFYQQGQIPTNRINTPITVIFDTTGTSLAGSDIACATAEGIRKISANVFAIDLDFTLGLQTHTVTSTASPAYYDFTKPTINSVTRSGDDLTVTTDIPCALSVFKGTSETSQSIAKRTGAFATSQTFTLTTTDYDNSLWVGVVSERGESTLSSALVL